AFVLQKAKQIQDFGPTKTIPVSPKEPTKKPGKAKKYVTSTKKTATKPKPTKKKTPVKADRGKGLNILIEVALSEAAPLKEVTKLSKKDFHISHASGSGDGTNFESGGDSREEDYEEEDDTEDDDANDGNDMVMIMMVIMMMMIVIMKGLSLTEMRILISISPMKNIKKMKTNLSEIEKIVIKCSTSSLVYRSLPFLFNYDVYVNEFTDNEDDADNANKENKEEIDDAKELYKDVNVNLRKEDVEMTDADQREQINIMSLKSQGLSMKKKMLM
ncbi:hypothetical protein Tco_1537547, partial [Tanacetum coccineum]